MIEDISMKDLLTFFDEKIAAGGKLRRRASTAAREPRGTGFSGSRGLLDRDRAPL